MTNAEFKLDRLKKAYKFIDETCINLSNISGNTRNTLWGQANALRTRIGRQLEKLKVSHD